MEHLKDPKTEHLKDVDLLVAFQAIDALCVCYAWYESPEWDRYNADRNALQAEICKRNLHFDEPVAYEALAKRARAALP